MKQICSRIAAEANDTIGSDVFGLRFHRTESSDHCLPNGRNMLQNNICTNRISPPFTNRLEPRTWIDTTKIQQPIVAQRVAKPTNSAVAKINATTKIAV